MGTFMRDSDAFSWYMERDPVLRSNVVAVAWFDQSPDWEYLRTKVDAATRLVPGFRHRLIEIPWRIANPRWVADRFDLNWHLRRFDASAPHDRSSVLDFAARESTASFDPVRPLWEFTLIEHLTGDRAALVLKVHHSLTDGVGGMALALHLFELEPNTTPPSEAPLPPVERFEGADLVRDALAHDAGRLARGLWGGARSIATSAPAALVHPLTAVTGTWEMAQSIARTVAPIRHRLSPIMTTRSILRRTDMVEVDVKDLKRAAATAEGTLNDAFMAAVTGGLRRYHDRHSGSVHSLRVTLPISLRTPDDPEGGNRITLMRFGVPVSEPDPARRIADIHERCVQVRHERSLSATDAIAGFLSLLPTGVIGGILKRVDFLASDVPGFGQPVYLGDACVERFVSFGPTIGTGVNVTLLSYNGICNVGVNVDTAAVPDGEAFTDCLIEGFEEVLALGGVHRPAQRSISAPDGTIRTFRGSTST